MLLFGVGVEFATVFGGEHLGFEVDGVGVGNGRVGVAVEEDCWGEVRSNVVDGGQEFVFLLEPVVAKAFFGCVNDGVKEDEGVGDGTDFSVFGFLVVVFDKGGACGDVSAGGAT